jgi:hypothetical protein
MMGFNDEGGGLPREGRGMLRFPSPKPVSLCNGLSRRDFLRVGGLSAGAVGLSLAGLPQLRAGQGLDGPSCILLFLVGGPSQVDTWDPKPAAPSTVRGPFKTARTTVPGLHLSEAFPLMAQRAERFAVVRSVHHGEAPIHETGHQLMQTGRLFTGGVEYPHYGSVLSYVRGRPASGLPPYVLLPGPIGNTGVAVDHGQGPGLLGPAHAPFSPGGELTEVELPPGLDPARPGHRNDLLRAVDDAERAAEASGVAPAAALRQVLGRNVRRAFDLDAEGDSARDRYGRNTFGQSCLLARRLVEHGVRLVTVNMFDTVFDNVTWDCHADGAVLSSTLDDYRDTLCPMFDRAYTALLDDLAGRGLLGSTLVVATGEFGRTPLLNSRGGRDHWPGVWSMLFAGGGVRGGQVVGSSDALGAEPRTRPVTPAEVAATVYRALGFDPAATVPGPDGRVLRFADAGPIGELF